MKEAIGNDGQWHDWNELTEEEQQAWWEDMDKADQIWEARKRGEYRPSLKENILEFESRKRLLH